MSTWVCGEFYWVNRCQKDLCFLLTMQSTYEVRVWLWYGLWGTYHDIPNIVSIAMGVYKPSYNWGTSPCWPCASWLGLRRVSQSAKVPSCQGGDWGSSRQGINTSEYTGMIPCILGVYPLQNRGKYLQFGPWNCHGLVFVASKPSWLSISWLSIPPSHKSHAPISTNQIHQDCSNLPNSMTSTGGEIGGSTSLFTQVNHLVSGCM